MRKEIIFVCRLSLKVKIKISFEGTEYRLTIISQFQELQFLLLLGEKKTQTFPIVIRRAEFFDSVNPSDQSMK